MNTSNGGFYYEVTSSGREGCNLSGLQPVVQDNTLCGNHRGNFGRRIDKIVQRQHIEVA